MTHMRVMDQFIEHFPNLKDTIDVWFQNGKNSIRIRFKNDSPELIFTFDSNKSWTLETVDKFYNKLKGDR